jgi:DNA primase
MFPICDEQGRVIAFSGRLLQPDAKAAKYVNSPETPIFSKSRVFYGLDKARRALLEAGSAVVCEGQLDMIACFMAGVENVVAPQGTAFTADHARILKRYASEAVLCFDSDEAGQNATLRSLDGLLESGLAVRVATIPAPDDPDSYIKAQGAQAFRSLIDQAPGFFDWLLERLCRQHSTESDRGRLAIAHVMAESLAKTGSAVLIDTHAQKVAARLGISSDAVRREFNRIRPGLGPAEVELETPVDDVPQPGAVELWLLRLLLSHLDLVPWAAAHLQTAWIQHPQVRRIVEGLYRVVEEDQWSGVADFVNGFGDGSLQGLITQCAAADQPIRNPAQQLPDIAVKLRNASLEVELAELQRRVGSPDLSEERRIEILQRQQAIRLLRRQSLPPVTD